jgi:hypothetical protein
MAGDGRLRHDRPPLELQRPDGESRWSPGGGDGHPVGSAALLTVVCLGLLLSMYNATVVNVMLPDMRVSLHASGTGLAWVAALYSLVYAALLMAGGRSGRGSGSGQRSWAGSRCSPPDRRHARPPLPAGSCLAPARCRRSGWRL